VNEAQRLATRELREMQEGEKNGKKNKRRKSDADTEMPDDEDIDLSAGGKAEKSNSVKNDKKKMKR
jgi:hypothetical protein